MVLAHSKQKSRLLIDDDELEILNPLKEILIKKRTLAHFFGLTGKSQTARELARDKFNPQDLSEESKESDSSDEEHLNTEEAEQLLISRNTFIEKIEKARFTQKKNKLHFLADRLIEEKKGNGDFIQLGDIEDFAIGFRQNHTKVFVFGQGHKKLFAFQNKPLCAEAVDTEGQAEESDEDEARMKQLQK